MSSEIEYNVICFCGENEIFVGVVESYILENRFQKNDDVETLQLFQYNSDTKYAIINYSGDFGSLFGIYDGDIKIIPGTNHFHFALDDIPEFDTEELGYFQLEPNKGIWIENGGYATGRFCLIEGRKKIMSMINRLL